MNHSYIAYIDESGDDGLKNFREPGQQGGASKWLCICACIIRATNRLQTVRWRDEIKNITRKKNKGRSIHFAEFNHNQKRVACQIINGKALTYISAISNKTTIPIGTYNDKNQLYFYVTRYVIERLSWFCRDNRVNVPEGDGRLKVIFSRRGGLSYSGFQNYLNVIKETPNGSKIHWPVIDIASIEAKDHSTDAGLQLADCGASAIAAALEPDPYGNIEAQYLHELQNMVYSRNGNYLSYGLKLLPEINQLELTPQQTAALGPFQ